MLEKLLKIISSPIERRRQKNDRMEQLALELYNQTKEGKIHRDERIAKIEEISKIERLSAEKINRRIYVLIYGPEGPSA